MPTRRRSRLVESPPHGFHYRTDFISQEKEQQLLDNFEGLEFEPVQIHGVDSKAAGGALRSALYA